MAVAALGIYGDNSSVDWMPGVSSHSKSLERRDSGHQDIGTVLFCIVLPWADHVVSLLSFPPLVRGSTTLYGEDFRLQADTYFAFLGSRVGYLECIAILMFGGLVRQWRGVGECTSMELLYMAGILS